MKFKFISSALILQLFFSQFICAQSRGVAILVTNRQTGKLEEIKLYDGSFALIIGESDYTNGWDHLSGVSGDVAAVKQILERQGFNVETAVNLISRDFDSRFKQFINDHGYDPNNRLLIYYAGHGHTLKSSGDGRELGYVVPVDAPDPVKDEKGFRQKAISMDTVQNYAKEIQAKHAIFIFDSCFSGKLVSRERVIIPPVILEDVAFPVRQFITAGAANQPVPDESIFRRSFVRGLEGEADRNGDGYITGTELADYLKEKVTNYSNRAQTPQYGKINDIELDKGDFVFVLSGRDSTATAPNNPTQPAIADPSVAEREAWNQIKESMNRADFALFLESFPNSLFAEQAKQSWERVWWDSIKNSLKVADFNEFLQKFPAGQYAEAAKFAVKRFAAGENSPAAAPVGSEAITAGTLITNSLGMKFAYVPAGSFQMGSNNGDADEKPVHLVSIGKGFLIGRTEVTQSQWMAVMGTNPSKFNGDDLPVERVSWDDAGEFIRKLNEKNDGFEYRLPTESEWEYAARAGTAGDKYGNLEDIAWYLENSDDSTHPVAQKRPNAFGLYDMLGNVYEYTEDIYSQSFTGLPADGAPNAQSGDLNSRVRRGGSWLSRGNPLRVANRASDAPSRRSYDVGFRVVARRK